MGDCHVDVEVNCHVAKEKRVANAEMLRRKSIPAAGVLVQQSQAAMGRVIFWELVALCQLENSHVKIESSNRFTGHCWTMMRS